MGLSIVKGILQLHNAAYGVESSEGQGSVFWLELPIADAAGNDDGDIADDEQ